MHKLTYEAADLLSLPPGRSGKLLMVLDSTVILSSGFRGINDHIFLSYDSGSSATTPLSGFLYPSVMLQMVELILERLHYTAF
jgi:hypothetical protein